MSSATERVRSDAAPDDIYANALMVLHSAQVPFLLGGAYAFASYTGIERDTKDLDIFVRPQDCQAALAAFAAAGYSTELTYAHWLGKAFRGDYFVDIIFSSGNGVARVDDEWFEYAVAGESLGIPVLVCPAEEMLWSKCFVMERERYDGADVAHLLRTQAENLDWPRLLRRFEPTWQVLLSHLLLFQFIYPGERDKIPAPLVAELIERWRRSALEEPGTAEICRGTLLSRAQYLVDVHDWGYRDGRLAPEGGMSAEEIAHWTAAIDK